MVVKSQCIFKTLLISFIFLINLTSCGPQNTRTKSSVVDYLYSKNSETIVQAATPILSLPIKVGIAFTPDQHNVRSRRNIWTGTYSKGTALTSVNKSRLLEKVADNFRSLKFVSEIEVIPSEYLTPQGGFSNLEQIKTMYGIDVIALVSYDQVQFTDENFLSLSYWTIIGAYIVSGEINDTSTMLDTVVYDISSKKMLFRAPGTSIVKGSSTPVNLSEELRRDSLEGFELSAVEMTKNLEFQLEKFKEKIKNKPEQVKIIHRAGYTGGGAISTIELTSLFILMALINLARYSNGLRNGFRTLITRQV